MCLLATLPDVIIDKIKSYLTLTSNSVSIKLLYENEDKVNWFFLPGNPSIINIDFKKINDDNSSGEELIEECLDYYLKIYNYCFKDENIFKYYYVKKKIEYFN